MEHWIELELIRLKWLEDEVKSTRRACVLAILVVLVFLLTIGGTVAHLLGFI
jgi:hypothetical protein